ncbi:radical SAM protein, partial [Candidatus Kuenenbacteria bacterium]|nr:radical SAM protein [Candidatus Kuenenbacteria bacterium]
NPFSGIVVKHKFCHLVAPNRLYLELTRACNLHCKMCYNAGGQALTNELTTVEWQGILDQMAEVGVFEARFTGGEATLRPDFLEILDYALAKGFYVSLATNGIWSKELKQEICRRPIDDVIVSLDGPPEINDKFRIGGSFKETMNTIIALKQAGIKKVRLNTVLSHLNWQHVEPLLAICEHHDLLLVDFIHPRPFGRGEEAKGMMLSAEETLAFNRLVEDWRIKHPTVKVIMDFDLLAKQESARHPIVPRIHACPAGREFAFVSPQGNVFPCGVAPVYDINLMTPREKGLFIAGSLREKKLLDIWHYSPVWKAYRDLRQCKPAKCFACKFWGKKCFGTCPIGAYYASGKLNGEDPYCYSHLLPQD